MCVVLFGVGCGVVGFDGVWFGLVWVVILCVG